MPHCDAVIDGNSIEFGGEATECFDFFLYNLSDFMQVGMSRYKLSERVDNSDYGATEMLLFHAVGTPQGTRSRHTSASGAHLASKIMGHILE